jgi:heterocyst specific transport system permease protein
VPTGLVLPIRLAWEQLRHEPRKLLAGVAGVVVAVVLMFMQLGFRDAMYDSATAVQRRMGGDLFIVHRESQTLWRMMPFSRRRVFQALAVPEVSQASYLYASLVDWKNPWTGHKRPALLFGIDPTVGLLNLASIPEQLDLIKDEDSVLFDAHSSAEFGPVAAVLRDGHTFSAEVNDRRLAVRGLFRLGASFAADGNIATSHQNFLRIVPSRSASQVDVGILVLRPGADRTRVQAAVQRLLPDDVRVITRAEFVRMEYDFWENGTGIGFIFALGALIGFVVGITIVYQILYTEVTNHLPHYALLTAIGYSHRFLLGIVGGAALIVGMLGYAPGVFISAVLYRLTEGSTSVPLDLDVSKLCLILVLTMTMCFISGGFAVRKLRDADPAVLF